MSTTATIVLIALFVGPPVIGLTLHVVLAIVERRRR